MKNISEATGSFATTRWSVVLAAGQDTPTAARKALEQLCQNYWYPLYSYVRRRGYQPQDAEDLTQAFITHLMERQAFAGVQRERGRFRSFLLTALSNFLLDQLKRSQAQKRAAPTISIDAAAESRFQADTRQQETPESAFERRWALQVLADVLATLRREYAEAGQTALFEQLHRWLTREPDAVHYADVARQLAITEAAVRMSAHRLRRRYRKALRAHIAETVASPEEVDDELRQLISALGR